MVLGAHDVSLVKRAAQWDADDFDNMTLVDLEAEMVLREQPGDGPDDVHARVKWNGVRNAIVRKRAHVEETTFTPKYPEAKQVRTVTTRDGAVGVTPSEMDAIAEQHEASMTYHIKDVILPDYRDRSGPWITLHSGRRFYPYDLKKGDILPDDIAHHTAMICRFGGALDQFYSVAQHCTNMAMWFTNPVLRMWCILHDAAEGLLGRDLCSPFKDMNAAKVEFIVGKFLWEEFGAPWVSFEDVDENMEVKMIDRSIRVVEARTYMTAEAFAVVSKNPFMQTELAYDSMLGPFALAMLENMHLSSATAPMLARNEWAYAFKLASMALKDEMLHRAAKAETDEE